MSNDLKEKIDLYKYYVNTSLEISKSRVEVNKFFITINSFIIGLGAFTNTITILFFGILINIIWVKKLKSYKILNTAKFKLIHKLEDEIPYKLFSEEEKIYKKDNRKNFSDLEIFIPILVITLYSVSIILFCSC